MRSSQINPHFYKVINHLPVLGLLILVLFVSGCYMPTAPSSDGEVTNNSPETTIVNLEFIAVLDQPISAGERLVIEVLDEVTGLPYNPLRYDMVRLSDLEFQYTLSITRGSVLKYRYARIGSTITPEATADGNPIRYRLAFGDRNNSFVDKITSWSGEITNQVTGLLTGTILDSITNEPIPDILVSAGGIMTFTDMNGRFNFGGLPLGLHNIVFYAIDGSYRTFQQGAVISSGTTTTATVNLQPMPLINVTFIVKPPADDLGLPIHIAGNLSQFGNTFTNLMGGMSVKPGRLPGLTKQADGSHTINLTLHQESDLRFKFTLGDGYWNAEQFSSGGLQTRQLIVPDHDITINFDIFKWRSNEFEPVIFQVTAPPGYLLENVPYIQLKTADWTEPIPLWQSSPESFIFVLFSPLDSQSNLTYRFCNDQNCIDIITWNSGKTEGNAQATSTPLTVPINFDSVAVENPIETESQVLEAIIPFKGATYTTAVEFTSVMDPSWIEILPQKMAGIDSLGINTIIFSPSLSHSSNPPFFQPVIGVTPFNYELSEILDAAQAAGFSTGLFPQPLVDPTSSSVIESSTHSEQWWDFWFENYSNLIVSYAKLAETSNVSSLYIGGKSTIASFQGGIYPEGTETDVPELSETYWLALLNDIRKVYHGQLVWVSNANLTMDPLPRFISEFDQIYVSIDTPLSTGSQPIIEELGYNFTAVIDNLIYEVYRSTGKPVLLAFGYPSIDGGAQGCQIINENCSNDGIFSSYEINGYATDLDEQALIYNALFPITASREWITGISIRGFEPKIEQHNGTSSIANKPAEAVVKYWYSGILGQ